MIPFCFSGVTQLNAATPIGSARIFLAMHVVCSNYYLRLEMPQPEFFWLDLFHLRVPTVLGPCQPLHLDLVRDHQRATWGVYYVLLQLLLRLLLLLLVLLLLPELLLVLVLVLLLLLLAFFLSFFLSFLYVFRGASLPLGKR